MNADDLSQFSMIDLFRQEVETHASALSDGLLKIESGADDPDLLRSLMRAAHSVKGAARIVQVELAEALAHAMEELFSAAIENETMLGRGACDLLLNCVDQLAQIAKATAGDFEQWKSNHTGEIDEHIQKLRDPSFATAPPQPSQTNEDGADENKIEPLTENESARDKDRFVRVSEQHLSRLLGLAGETLVETRWLRPFSDSLLKLRHAQTEVSTTVERLKIFADSNPSGAPYAYPLQEIDEQLNECRNAVTNLYNDFELHARRTVRTSNNLYRSVVASKLRPFTDGVRPFPRMVRDIAQSLGKKVKFKIDGHQTQVDRDILEKMESPLNHLIRNAIDHGIETPPERASAGKPETGVIHISATHRSGFLIVQIEDDGRGIGYDSIRRKVIKKGLAPEEMVEKLTEAELMEFLFLPGFSTSDTVTEISGRGFGLDVVHNAIREVGGLVRAFSTPGKGMRFELQLPLTLSIVRALLVEIAGEPYAFPVARIDRVLHVERERIERIEDQPFVTVNERHIGLVSARQALELDDASGEENEWPVVLLSDRFRSYGLVVDRILEVRRLVVRTLDPRLGKVADISAATLLDDGTPALILDVDDLLRTIDDILSGGRLKKFDQNQQTTLAQIKKRVLVVDDSLTVREVERQLLLNHGYDVETAVDGIDGWNALRRGEFDLVVTDVDMPRLNGFELVQRIKQDERLRSMPVMIVSYKDREQDRRQGMEAGADYYLTKSSFHDETLLQAVDDLIGEAD
ncbi:MAG: hybrid sensor histidine kinase/response regulator [Candidatus Hinthialibacter antarcticus]|nr:hybrid sensor histidine kinase/response regulator [Candidatus Hinthialibacter antarcticus]